MNQYQFPYYPSGSSAAEIQNLDQLNQLDNSLLQSNVIQEFYKESQEPLTGDKSISLTANLHTKFGSYRPMAWTTETLLQLLHTTNNGRYIFADYKKNNGFLSDDSQNLLTKLLINHLLQDQSRGTDFYFRKIAELIIEIFPKEQISVYFIPAKSEGQKQTHAKGKLIERWKNVARRLRAVGAITLERHTKNQANVVLAPGAEYSVFSDEVLDAKQWLQADGLAGDINLVKAKWLITYDLRKKEVFESEDRLLSTIFQSWPILQGPKGYELILEDFKSAFPHTTDVLYNDWNDFLNAWEILSARIVDIRRSSVKDKFGQVLLAKLDVSYQKKGYFFF